MAAHCCGHEQYANCGLGLKLRIGQLRSCLFPACLLLGLIVLVGQARSESSPQEWKSYGHDPGGKRFSTLHQINRTNVRQLQRAWTYELPTNPGADVAAFESTPLMVDDALYFATPAGQAIALDAETGKQ